jgi:hypothetical protein
MPPPQVSTELVVLSRVAISCPSTAATSRRFRFINRADPTFGEDLPAGI